MSIGSALGSVKKKGLRKSLSALKRRIARDRLKGDLAVFKKNAAALTQDDSLEKSKKIEMAGDINSFIISNLTVLRYSDLAELCTGVAKFIAEEQAGLDNSQKLELSSGALAFASEQCKNKLKLTPEPRMSRCCRSHQAALLLLKHPLLHTDRPDDTGNGRAFRCSRQAPPP